MDRIRLDLDELRVDSFATADTAEAERGMLKAAESGICGTSKIGGCWCTEAC